MKSPARIAFVGGGNMAASLIGGLLREGASPRSMVAADPDANQLAKLSKLGIDTTTDNRTAAHGCRVLVLAVKPQVMHEVVRGLVFTPDQLVISIAAGVTMSSIERWGANNVAVVRCMPNTPALYGAGITALCANARATVEDRGLATSVLTAAGVTLWVADEADLDAVTAVSGSGPAYFLYLIEAMITAGTSLGLDEATARALTFETARGAAIMAASSDDSPAELRRKVTSKGGTTERALAVLDEAFVKTSIERAVVAAAERSRELAAELDRSASGGGPV